MQRLQQIQDEINAEYIRRQENLVSAATATASISPTSCFTFAAHRIAGTGPEATEHIRKQFKIFFNDFQQFIAAKMEAEHANAQSGSNSSTIEYFTNADGTLGARPKKASSSTLDLSGLPRFSFDKPDLSESLIQVLPNLAMLVLYSLVMIVMSYVAFFRYDVR
jgi:ABC-type transport system involved in multi-copper enzyme maturation permease subunit